MSPVVRNLLIVVLNTACIYAFLAATMRVFSRRQLGQLTALDLMVIILLGSAVETAMVHGETSLKAGIASGTTLFITNYVIARLIRRSKRFGHICSIGPVILVHDGKFVEEHMRSSGLTCEDVMHALRQREHADLTNVRFAVLEADGQINVIPVDMG